MRVSLHLALSILALLLGTMLLLEWRSDRQDRARLQDQLNQAEQSLQHASASQADRDKQLSATLAQLNDLKSTVKTQQQILAKLPAILPLPKPILPPADDVKLAGAQSKPDSPVANAPVGATLPTEDLKPLYDFAIDCRTCQAKLAVVTSDLADEKTKTEALSRERDAALKLAKGGSLRQRFGRALKWFAIGAAVGIIASKH
jgi:hypothetical protein